MLRETHHDVFLAIPCYGNKVGAETIASVMNASINGIKKTVAVLGFSILTRNFNMLYAEALNSRTRHTVFCMLHDDISPEIGWMDKMLQLMDSHNADILSVVSPIKDNRGMTSTALDIPLGNSVRRLSLTELYTNYDATFTHEKLLVNSGLMMVRLTDSRCEKLWFSFEDSIIKNADGKFEAIGLSEDWTFSRRAHAEGLRVFATREVKLTHTGQMKYDNSKWGQWTEDR